MECLSFGVISQVFSNIKDRGCRKAIGDVFQQYSEIVKSWMRSLSFTRNLCAHHARLWNRFFINTPKNVDIAIHFDRDKSSFILQAYIIIKLMNAIDPPNKWKERLRRLLIRYDLLVEFKSMGFDDSWQNSELWNI